MEVENSEENPWVSFTDNSRNNKKIFNKFVHFNFLSTFNKSSSVIQCSICRIIFLKNHILQHFKCHHSKRFAKKSSKFKLPYDAIEAYDLFCESQKNKRLNLQNVSGEILVKPNNSETITLRKRKKIVQKLNKKSSGRLQTKNIESKRQVTEKNSKDIRRITTNSKIEESKTLVISDTDKLDNFSINNTPKKSNVKSNSVLSSTESAASPLDDFNIFDKISTLCDNKPISDQSSSHGLNSRTSFIRQNGIDESYGCTIFTDEHNNSILIDNDKDEFEDLDCYESSVSNDSAYYSLPNTNSVSVSNSTSSRLNNFYDSSVVPPLVTAYQFNYLNNNISCSSSSNSFQHRPKNTPSTTIHVSRSCGGNTIIPTRSNVKHRFYISGHNNKDILKSILQKSQYKCNPGSNNIHESSIYSDDSKFAISDRRNILNFVNQNSIDFSPFNEDKNNSIQMMNRDCSSRWRSKENFCIQRRTVFNKGYWGCTQENGFSGKVIIPRKLKWINKKNRYRNNFESSVNSRSLSDVTGSKIPTTSQMVKVSDNPLLSSYTIETSKTDNFKNDSNSCCFVNYQFHDRNQMSFQQRLLERGVISQRDISRSQRYLSFNNYPSLRKNTKLIPVKQNFVESKSNGKNSIIKSVMIPQMVNELPNSIDRVINQNNVTNRNRIPSNGFRNRPNIAPIINSERNHNFSLSRVHHGLCSTVQSHSPTEMGLSRTKNVVRNVSNVGSSSFRQTNNEALMNYKYQSSDMMTNMLPMNGHSHSIFSDQNICQSSEKCVANRSVRSGLHLYGCYSNKVGLANHSTAVVNSDFNI